MKYSENVSDPTCSCVCKCQKIISLIRSRSERHCSISNEINWMLLLLFQCFSGCDVYVLAITNIYYNLNPVSLRIWSKFPIENVYFCFFYMLRLLLLRYPWTANVKKFLIHTKRFKEISNSLNCRSYYNRISHKLIAWGLSCWLCGPMKTMCSGDWINQLRRQFQTSIEVVLFLIVITSFHTSLEPCIRPNIPCSQLTWCVMCILTTTQCS